MWCESFWPPWLFRLSNNLFLVSIVALLMWTLIRHRRNDSYRDNYFFLLVLPLFPLAKYLILSPDDFQAWVSMGSDSIKCSLTAAGTQDWVRSNNVQSSPVLLINAAFPGARPSATNTNCQAIVRSHLFSVHANARHPCGYREFV